MRERRGFRLAIVALLFLAAPTAGDIGSCNQTLSALDPAKFSAVKQNIDCNKCLTCGFTTHPCMAACGVTAVKITFPKGAACRWKRTARVWPRRPRRGGVRRRYASYVADTGSTTPTECALLPPSQERERASEARALFALSRCSRPAARAPAGSCPPPPTTPPTAGPASRPRSRRA